MQYKQCCRIILKMLHNFVVYKHKSYNGVCYHIEKGNPSVHYKYKLKIIKIINTVVYNTHSKWKKKLLLKYLKTDQKLIVTHL